MTDPAMRTSWLKTSTTTSTLKYAVRLDQDLASLSTNSLRPTSFKQAVVTATVAAGITLEAVITMCSEWNSRWPAPSKRPRHVQRTRA